MSTYVLVHGSWAWHNIIPLLEKQGHKVVAPDLPDHGRDHSIPPSAVTLRSYTDHLNGIIKEQNEPVILVGHSMGGIVVSQTAEKCSDMIQKLVYVTGYLVPSGSKMEDHAQTGSSYHQWRASPGPSIHQRTTRSDYPEPGHPDVPQDACRRMARV